jgi:hypothetical protein
MAKKRVCPVQTNLDQWLRVRDLSVIWLMRQSGVSYPTCYQAVTGHPIRYNAARAISETTGGVITIDELCAPKKSTAA